MTPPELSVVVPVYNEEAGLAEFHGRLWAALKELALPFEIIYVDDGSRDGSAALIRSFHDAEPAVHALYFSRNFGHQLAITAGMDHARGRACVVLDADGQDPPETIPALVAKWKEGFEVVYAVRASRAGETLFKRATAALFYRLLGRIARVDLPLDAGDFRLLDRRVVEVMRRLRENHRFVRGLTAWAGFRYARVEYDRQARLAGETHYPLTKMVRFAMDGVTAFSHIPLRVISWLGALFFALAVAVGGWVVWVKLFNPGAVQGWASLMAVVLLIGSVQMLSLGIIGEYLAHMFDEVKRRPLYVVARADGFDENELRPYS